MSKSYNILNNKSIIQLILVLLIFGLVSPAWSATFNDPGYLYQKSIFEQINAPAAWDLASGSSSVVVAVIDTGVDFDHPDLKDNMWVNTDEIAGNEIDDDNNGYVDDIYGWNYVEDNGLIKAPDAGGFNNELEPRSHGTVIAGLIGAKANNATNGLGLNSNVRIMALRAIDNFGSGSYDNIGKAIDYAALNGADIISVSFVGEAYDASLHDTLKRAYDRGVLIVLAAGNSRQYGIGDLNVIPLYPICFDTKQDNWLLGVTSIDAGSELSSFANYGSCVDVAAPGEKIYSTERISEENNYSGFGGLWQGTSFAVPYVVGAAALVKSVQPDWTAKDIIHAILSSADDIEKTNPGYAGRLGYGRLNVGQAVKQALQNQADQTMDRLCWYQSGKLFCYDSSSDKTTFIKSFRNKPVSFDWSGRNNIVALVPSGSGFEISLLSGSGDVRKIWGLGSAEKFSKIKFLLQNDKTSVAVGGINKKTGQFKLKFFDLTGNSLSEIVLPNTPADWLVLDDGRVITARIVKGLSVISIYSNTGVKLSEKKGPAASAISDVSFGKIWTGTDDAVAMLCRQGSAYFSVIYDLSSGAYKRDTLAGPSVYPWHLRGTGSAAKSSEIMFYRDNGGRFDVWGRGGELVRSIQLPSFK